MLVADLTEDISVGQAGEEPTLSSSEKSVELEATEANRFSESQSATRTKSGVPGPTRSQTKLIFFLVSISLDLHRNHVHTDFCRGL